MSKFLSGGASPCSYLQLVVTKKTDDSGHTDPAHDIFSLKEPNEAGERHFQHSAHPHPPVPFPDPLPTWMLGFWALRSTLASPGKFCRSSMKGRLSSRAAGPGWGSAGLLAFCWASPLRLWRLSPRALPEGGSSSSPAERGLDDADTCRGNSHTQQLLRVALQGSEQTTAQQRWVWSSVPNSPSSPSYCSIRIAINMLINQGNNKCPVLCQCSVLLHLNRQVYSDWYFQPQDHPSCTSLLSHCPPRLTFHFSLSLFGYFSVPGNGLTARVASGQRYHRSCLIILYIYLKSLQPGLYDKGENLNQINCSVVLVLGQMTSSNTGLIEISGGAQMLPQRQKETAGRCNPATFSSLGKGRCPAKQVNKTHSRVLPMALSAAAIPGLSLQSQQEQWQQRGSLAGEAAPSSWGAREAASKRCQMPALAPSSHVPRPALGAHWHGQSVTPGASRLQCAQETRDGNNWQSPPEARVSLERSAGPRSSGLGAEVPELPASPPAAAYFWLPS